MKKTTKSLLTTSLILVCAGLLLSLGSFIFAAVQKIDIFGVENIPYVSTSKDYSLSGIMENSPDADFNKKLTSKYFTRIDVLSFVGKVEFLPTTEETHISLENANPDNINVRVIGSTLTIAEQREVGFMGVYIGEKGFSFKGLRQIFGPGNSANTAKVITVYLNEEDLTESISVHSYFGDVKMEKVSGTVLSVSSTIGNVDLKELHFNRIEVNQTIGKLSLSDNNAGAVNATVHFGKVNARIPFLEGQSTIIDLWVGSCNIETDAALNDYKLSLNTTVGSVQKNGVNTGRVLQEYSEAASRISSTVLLGKISVNGNVLPDTQEGATSEPVETNPAPYTQTTPEMPVETAQEPDQAEPDNESEDPVEEPDEN